MTNQSTPSGCTCHPDEAPVPCQHKYAFSECVEAATNAQAPRLGGYYLNSLQNWRKEIKRDLLIGNRRMRTLDSIGSSCANDHRAAMSVRRRMLAIVEEALQDAR